MKTCETCRHMTGPRLTGDDGLDYIVNCLRCRHKRIMDEYHPIKIIDPLNTCALNPKHIEVTPQHHCGQWEGME